MKSTLFLPVVMSLAMLAGAVPTMLDFPITLTPSDTPKGMYYKGVCVMREVVLIVIQSRLEWREGEIE